MNNETPVSQLLYGPLHTDVEGFDALAELALAELAELARLARERRTSSFSVNVSAGFSVVFLRVFLWVLANQVVLFLQLQTSYR